jgi:Cytochrome c7 and related cytochrome c
MGSLPPSLVERLRAGCRQLRAIAAIAWTIAACASPRPPVPPPSQPVDLTMFPHQLHRTQACEPCHDGDARPGLRDHAPCDEGKCHRDAFTELPGRLCTICHLEVSTTAGGIAAPLQPFPRTTGWRALPSVFSHQRHLDSASVEAAVGFHLACSDCHAADDAGKPQHAGHAACARCHSDEVALGKAPTMPQCGRCHGDSSPQPRTRARVISGDLHFEHGNHLVDRAGTAISCRACHRDSAAATTYDDHRPPQVERCVPCHDDSKRVPSTARMRACETCHTSKRGSLLALAPRNHLPGTERPLDHTLAFRTDHGDDAARDATRCATCHTTMSGSPRDACDECHRVTRPADHRLAWRELDHGTESAATPERCALCHTADSCQDCHRQLPRSHLPLSEFRFAHGPAARINVRSCLACHDPAQDCSGAGCHQDGAGLR